VWVAASCLFAQDAPPKAPDFIQRRTEQKGLALDMFVQPLAPSADGKIHLRQGDPVSFRFRISDTASGAPIRNIQPAAWLEPRHPGEQRTSEGCIQKLKGFMGGGLSTAAETDLNVFYALTLNADPSISVVDPLFSFGGSKLLALVPLRSPGYDWVLGADRRKLFVAEPGANSVADRHIDVEGDGRHRGVHPSNASRHATGSALPLGGERGVSSQCGGFRSNGHQRRDDEGGCAHCHGAGRTRDCV